jgi:hypothetical protein
MGGAGCEGGGDGASGGGGVVIVGVASHVFVGCLGACDLDELHG